MGLFEYFKRIIHNFVAKHVVAVFVIFLILVIFAIITG